MESEIYLRGSLSVFALYDLFGEYCKTIKVESITVRVLYTSREAISAPTWPSQSGSALGYTQLPDYTSQNPHEASQISRNSWTTFPRMKFAPASHQLSWVLTIEGLDFKSQVLDLSNSFVLFSS